VAGNAKTRITNRSATVVGEPKRRVRAPKPVILRLRTDLAENKEHPLAKLDPQQREAERQQLFAMILARLSNGPNTVQVRSPTINERSTTEDDRETTSNEG
jgi:hypothetical protein